MENGLYSQRLVLMERRVKENIGWKTRTKREITMEEGRGIRILTLDEHLYIREDISFNEMK